MRKEFSFIACMSAPFLLATLQACAPATSEEARASQYRALRAAHFADMSPEELAEERDRVVDMVRRFCSDFDLTEEQISNANGGGDILLEESLGCPEPAAK